MAGRQDGVLSMIAFLEKHPQLHNAMHVLSAAVSFLLIAPNEELAQMMTALPGSITTHRYFGFGLALLTFTRAFVRGAKALGAGKPADPAAPVVPASEALTKVEKIDAEKSK
jgi:hypothetical protein